MIPDSTFPLTVRAVLVALPEQERRFMEKEIQLMAQTHPGDPPVGVMQSTGKLYWVHRYNSNNVRPWRFMILCDGFSPVRLPLFTVIPMQPGATQLQREAAAAGLDLSSRMHPYPELGTFCLDVSDHSPYHIRPCGTHTSAATYAWKANSLAYYFDMGTKDPQVWNEYCGQI